jgi:hypothetical protein
VPPPPSAMWNTNEPVKIAVWALTTGSQSLSSPEATSSGGRMITG